MLHRYLAALCLVPASFVVYKTAREWLKAAALGRYYFFSVVAKSAPTAVRRSPSRVRNLFVYYPMKVGLDLLNNKSTTATLRKMWQRVARKLLGAHHGQHDAAPPPQAYSAAKVLDPGRIKRLLADPAITVVSFDIFDTLLVRPALQPKDIFHVVAKKVNAAHGVDFVRLRWDAEERLGKPNATIHEIYAHMAQTHGLAPTTATALMEEEIRCEQTLLSPRADMQGVYAEAVRLGKRVIAVSDMYLPAEVLDGFLQKNGYAMAVVYVSCEHGARKSDGGLYDHVIAAEGVHPSEILHLGDNYQSDYVRALEKNITALHYPAIQDMCFGAGAPLPPLFAEAARKDPAWSLFMGFSLNRLYGEYATAPSHIFALRDMRHFAELVMAPLVTGFCLSLAELARTRGGYNAVYFASRDGYLPHKIYSIIAEHMNCLPGVYFYAGRRAYYPYLHGSFFDYADALCRVNNPHSYTLNDFITAHFDGTDLVQALEAGLSEQEKNLLFFQEKKRCITILNRFRADIDACMREKCSRMTRYYDAVFAGEKDRLLVFDLGYSGSIGRALSAITGKKIDKAYFWEDPENKASDKAQGSTTWVFMKNPGYVPYNLMLEELFSPCQGGVIDFDQQARPVFEQLALSEAHKADMAAAHGCCESFAREFCALLGDYARYATLHEPDAAIDICRTVLSEMPFCTLSLFKNIVLPDRVHYSSNASLEKKMEKFFPQTTVFTGTGFENPHSTFAAPPRLTPGHGSIGIHAHVYTMALSQEMLCYLQDFPAPFDLFVTYTHEARTRTMQNLFSRAVMPNARSVTMLPVPNRGRDVAPWLLSMRPYQAAYDLFCHIHAKESQHIGFGEQWRKYLFDNVIKSDTATDILNIFTADPHMGCIFPAIYPKVRAVMTDVGVPLYGSEHEYALICGLLRKMGMQDELCRTELLFSVGTMLWYRPQALRQLFTVDLGLDDFAEEPIGVGGTLAHAVERLPAVVATRNGYAAKSFTRYA